MQIAAPKRFYDEVSLAPVNEGFEVHLDGRAIKSGRKTAVTLPTERLAQLVADEWAAQGEHIELASMPLTRLSQRATDLDEDERERVRADITKYAASDLLCFRAPEPDALVVRQTETWQPLLDWAEATLGLTLNVTAGLVGADQPEASLQALETHVAGLSDWELVALSPAVALLGSVVLGLALHAGRLGPREAFEAAHVDELWQAEQWGVDEEAEARRAGLSAEVEAIARFLDALS